jgi:hypothetical protein
MMIAKLAGHGVRTRREAGGECAESSSGVRETDSDWTALLLSPSLNRGLLVSAAARAADRAAPWVEPAAAPASLSHSLAAASALTVITYQVTVTRRAPP